MTQDQVEKQLAIIDDYEEQVISTRDVETKGEWREDCKALALAAVDKLPDGRARAIVLTKIEEALLWGHRAIDRAIPSQSQE